MGTLHEDIIAILKNYGVNIETLGQYRRSEIQHIISYLRNILLNFYKPEYIYDELIYQILCDVCPSMNRIFAPAQWTTPSAYILGDLKNRFQPEQRSPEWYAFRKNRLTASDIASVLGYDPYKKPDKVLLKKCGYEEPFVISPPCAHGIKFEPVATEIYELRKNVTVHEFGCLPHPEHSFIGASPDGIVENGIMLEIKNPYSRKIVGVPPKYYWTQMQIQLEVCDLEICDFLECTYNQYASYEALKEGEKDKQHTNEEYSVVVEYVTSDKDTKYRYCPLNVTDTKKVKWVEETLTEVKRQSILYEPVVTWWALKHYNVFTVRRNEQWFASVREELRQFWQKVEDLRKDKVKFQSMLPKTRKKKCKLLSDDEDDTDLQFNLFADPY